MNYRAPPEKGNAARAGNPDGEDSKVDYKIYVENSSKIIPEVQADYRRLIGDLDDFDSPLDHVVKMTLFKDVLGYEAEPLNVSMRDLYDELPHWTATEKSGLPLIVGGVFGDVVSSKGSLRHAGNRKSVTAAVCDYDGAGAIPFDEVKQRLEDAGVAAVLYTSPSHTEDAPRYRLVFPLSREHSTADLAALTDRANGFLDGLLASESWSPVQPFYLGQVTSKPEMQRALVDGDFLDARPDLPSIPSKGGSTKHRDKVEDPREKSGVVGAWCRTFDIHDAIERFIPSVYVPAGRGRYRFKAGSSKVGGAAVYDDGTILYSNHDSDPCAHKATNAFDLVRIHRFGPLDEGLDPDTPVTALPSYRAMVAFARTFDAVADELAAEEAADREAALDDFEDLGPLPGEEMGGDDFLFADQWTIGRADRYVVKRMIGEGDIGAIIGAPGSGKSLIAPYLARQIARGEEAFGLRTREHGVLYVSGEDALGIVGRFLGLGRQENIGIATRLTNLNPGSPDLAKLRKMVSKYKPGIIFIDTLAACFPGLEENSSEGMSKVLVAARSLAKLGAAVCLIHHSAKTSDGTPRGHSSLNGALDFALELLPKDDNGVIRGVMRKNRSGPCDIDVAFRVDPVDMGEDADGDRITVPVCRPLTASPRARVKISPAEKAALTALEETKWATADNIVRLEDWRIALWDNAAVSAAGDLESRKRAARRAIEGLARKGFVRVRDGVVFHPSADPREYDDLDELAMRLL